MKRRRSTSASANALKHSANNERNAMRVYIKPLEMIKEVERDLFEMGTRYQTATVQDKLVADNPKFQTIELMGYGYCLTQWNEGTLREMLTYAGVRNRSEWAIEEIDERLGLNRNSLNLNPGKAWTIEADFWKPFLRDGKFAYSYAERWQWQIPYIIDELTLRPNTRQAVLTMYDQSKDLMNWGGRDRVPCSLTYHFMIREGRLNLIYQQRSCDFVNFLAPDVYFAIGLLDFVAGAINVDSGQFIHNINSLHAFRGDLEKTGRSIF